MQNLEGQLNKEYYGIFEKRSIKCDLKSKI